MHRRLSSFVKPSSSRVSVVHEEHDDGLDNESKAPTIAPRDEDLPVPSLKVKRVDHYYSRWSRQWKYRVKLLLCEICMAVKRLYAEHELSYHR